MKKKISVIIPAYNSESTIERCLESVLVQSYKNLEIIVINDGSQDNTESVVENIANKDSRIKLYSIPNGGVSNARNVGIDNATGEYITFVDSDDTIEPDMYEFLINLFDVYDVDIAHCSYTTVYSDNKKVPVGNTGRVVVQGTDEAVDCLISGKLFASGLCNKLYKNELFNGVRLNKGIKFNEDGLMNFFLFRKAQKTVYTDKAFYNYFQCETSATHTANQLKSALDGHKVSSIICENSKGYSYEECAKKRLASSQLGLFGVYSLNKKLVSTLERKEMLNKVKSSLNEGMYTRNEKIKLFLYRYIPFIYKCFYVVYDKIRVKQLDPKQ